MLVGMQKHGPRQLLNTMFHVWLNLEQFHGKFAVKTQKNEGLIRQQASVNRSAQRCLQDYRIPDLK